MKNLFALLLLASIVVTSCTSDDDENPGGNELTSEEASARIVETGNAASTDIVSMVESEGVDALMSFSDLFSDFDQFSGRAEQRSWTKAKLQILSQYFVQGPASRVSTDDEFTFDEIKGIFEWNPELEEFEQTGEGTTFKVLFPSEGSTSNNAELELTDLQFITIVEEDEWDTYESEYPTVFAGTLKVDDVTYISLDASANWSNEGFPEKVSVDLLVLPFTFALNFDDTNNLSSSIKASLSKEEVILMGVDVVVDFDTADKDEPAKIDGKVQYGSLKLSGNVDVAGYDSNAYDENGDMADGFDANEYIDLEVLIDDVKIGDISFEEDIAYIVYLDGEKEILEELLEDVIAEIEESTEEILNELEGEDEEESEF